MLKTIRGGSFFYDIFVFLFFLPCLFGHLNFHLNWFFWKFHSMYKFEKQSIDRMKDRSNFMNDVLSTKIHSSLILAVLFHFNFFFYIIYGILSILFVLDKVNNFSFESEIQHKALLPINGEYSNLIIYREGNYYTKGSILFFETTNSMHVFYSKQQLPIP